MWEEKMGYVGKKQKERATINGYLRGSMET